jgi:hypothetical protein
MRARLVAALVVASLVLTALAATRPGAVAASTPLIPRPASMAVIGHIDSGINPYHEVFRDPSALAQQHPSTYIPGYPDDAEALRLTLDAPTFEAAFAADRKVWERLAQRYAEGDIPASGLFWVPGTRIIGATRFSAGGTWCPSPQDAVTPSAYPVHDCTDWPILDDHGHGTMTASRMAGSGTSLCPECRIVSVEGLGDAGVAFLADLGFVDVQTNSWAFVVGHPVIGALDIATGGGISRNLETAAATHLVYFATGNGIAGAAGFVTWPTLLSPTLTRDAVWVGAHDNGRVVAWTAAPAHVVADGFGGLTAGNRAVKGIGPSAFACCTSASSPYAASMGAALVLHARSMLGDTRIGIRDGIVARGTPPAGTKTGPIADGTLTLDELRWLVKHAAEPRPSEGRHDGAIHWLGTASVPVLLPYGPGDNAFCVGCWTLPVSWADVPPGGPDYGLIGYGGATEASLLLAQRVLRGATGTPDRSDVDAFFAAEGEARRAVQHPVP